MLRMLEKAIVYTYQTEIGKDGKIVTVKVRVIKLDNQDVGASVTVFAPPDMNVIELADYQLMQSTLDIVMSQAKENARKLFL